MTGDGAIRRVGRRLAVVDSSIGSWWAVPGGWHRLGGRERAAGGLRDVPPRNVAPWRWEFGRVLLAVPRGCSCWRCETTLGLQRVIVRWIRWLVGLLCLAPNSGVMSVAVGVCGCPTSHVLG
jgi:hypothetical protein